MKVVFLAVLAAQHFRLQLAAEKFYIMELVSQTAVEGLALGVLRG